MFGFLKQNLSNHVIRKNGVQYLFTNYRTNYYQLENREQRLSNAPYRHISRGLRNLYIPSLQILVKKCSY